MMTDVFRAVLDTHYQEDRRQRPEDGAKSKVNLMMKDSTLIEDGKLAMEVNMSHDARIIMMMMTGVPGHTEG